MEEAETGAKKHGRLCGTLHDKDFHNPLWTFHPLGERSEGPTKMQATDSSLVCAPRNQPSSSRAARQRESAVSTWSMTKQVSPARYKENNLRVFKVDKHSFVTNLGYG